MSNIDRIISEQILAWSRREAKSRQKRQEMPSDWPVITISRQFGAKGKSLAEALSKCIGFKIWDKELLSAIADDAGADEKLLASLDEKRRKMIDDTLYGFLMGFKHSNTHYFRSLLRVVQTIGAHGKSIIVGRGSNYIIKSPESLSVRLVSPIDERVPYVAEREDISKEKARKLILARDAERKDFISHYFKRDPETAHDFDIVINSGVFNVEQMVELILVAYEKKTGKALPLAV